LDITGLTVTLLEDLDFSFKFLRAAACENYKSFVRATASEQYLVLEFGFTLNKSVVGWELRSHTSSFSTTLLLKRLTQGSAIFALRTGFSLVLFCGPALNKIMNVWYMQTYYNS